jgi:hypothetical protein
MNVEAVGDRVHATSGSSTWVFHSVWIGEGFPNDLLRVPEHALKDDADTSVKVVTARRISRGTRQELESRGVSWADLSGRAHIEAEPGLLIERLPAKTTEPVSTSTKWSVSAGAVAETILHLSGPHQPGDSSDHVNQVIAAQIAEISGYSYPQVNKVLQQFELAEYVKKVGTERGSSARRYLKNPSSLLSDWAGWHKERPLSTVNMQPLWRGADETIEAVRRSARGEWAATGWLAADQLAPFSTSVPSVACYVERRAFERTVDALLQVEDIDYAQEVGRLSVTQAESHVMRMADRSGRVPVVSAVRVYGDLIRLGGRGEDAAQHLREVLIGY